MPRSSVYFGLNSVNWSLSVDAFFYPVFPFLVVRLARLGLKHGRAGIPFTILIGAAANADLAGREARLRGRPLVFLGVLSYAFYLVHNLAIDVLARYLADGLVIALSLSLPSWGPECSTG